MKLTEIRPKYYLTIISLWIKNIIRKFLNLLSEEVSGGGEVNEVEVSKLQMCQMSDHDINYLLSRHAPPSFSAGHTSTPPCSPRLAVRPTVAARYHSMCKVWVTLLWQYIKLTSHHTSFSPEQRNFTGYISLYLYQWPKSEWEGKYILMKLSACVRSTAGIVSSGSGPSGWASWSTPRARRRCWGRCLACPASACPPAACRPTSASLAASVRAAGAACLSQTVPASRPAVGGGLTRPGWVLI